jgi:AraC-like DNA-binding protein
MSEVVTFEVFEQEVQDLLRRLHDDTYQPTPMICRALGCAPGSEAASIQSAMLRQIAALTPPMDTPSTAYSRRVHDVLHYRYVERLTLEETAELLGLSVRHLARIQRNVVHALSCALWERIVSLPEVSPDQVQTPCEEEGGWQQQVTHELQALVSAAPVTRANVAEVIHDVLALGSALTGGRSLEIGYVQPGIVAAIHPAAMRQMLITRDLAPRRGRDRRSYHAIRSARRW